MWTKSKQKRFNGIHLTDIQQNSIIPQLNGVNPWSRSKFDSWNIFAEECCVCKLSPIFIPIRTVDNYLRMRNCVDNAVLWKFMKIKRKYQLSDKKHFFSLWNFNAFLISYVYLKRSKFSTKSYKAYAKPDVAHGSS